MGNEKDKRIAFVMPPITLSMTALARYENRNRLDEWLLRYGNLVAFTKYATQWIELSNIYMYAEGLLWLFLRLPFKLIKGKYSLFIANARDPQGIITFIISKLLRKPILLSDTFYMWSESTKARLLWPFSRFVSARATFLFVPSWRVADFWKSANIPAGKIRHINHYVSTIEVNEENRAEATHIKEKIGYQKTVLFIGRLIEAKGPEYLIKAFARLSEVKNVGLLIVGEGPDRNRLEALCRELKLSNVAFIWRVRERINIAPYYLLSDLLVLPSITLKTHEEWGLVVNEAMSAAKPVVVSSSVGCAFELVKDGVNGYIVPEKNVEALYEAIKKLLTNDVLRTQMGKESERTIANGFTYTHAIKSFKKLLQDALERAA